MPLKTTRRPITDEGAERLAEAIMLRAVDDWFNAHRWIGKLIKKRNAALAKAAEEPIQTKITLRYRELMDEQRREIRAIEKFFHSELYSLVMTLDAESFLSILRKQLGEKCAACETREKETREEAACD